VMTDIRFFVPGIPAPQGSKRHVGNGRMVESSKKVAPWRAAVVRVVREQGLAHGLTNPINVTANFVLPKPKTIKREWPTTRPDLDKLIRSTFDALTTSGLWLDDSLAISVTATKVYALDDMPTGAYLRIQPVIITARGRQYD